MVFSNGDVCTIIYVILASTAFNRALSPEIVGETTIDLFNFMQPHLNQPINVYETIQRPILDVLGKLAFGYKFGVTIFCIN